MLIRTLKISFALVFCAIFFYSCRTTRFVPEGQYLLKDVVIKTDDKNISINELDELVQQKENKKIMYIKLHLFIFNVFYSRYEKDPANWLGNTIGEAPVIYDQFLTQKTISQFKQYLTSKGYYNAEITDSLGIDKWNNKAATLHYRIKANKPYTIKKNDYQILDPKILQIVLSDTAATNLKQGRTFDLSLFERERERIVRQLKEHGYYYFNADLIHYVADTALATNEVYIKTLVGYSQSKEESEEFINTANKPCYIRQIHVYPSFDPKEAIVKGDEYVQSFDSTTVGNYLFFYREKQTVSPEVILKTFSISTGEKYDIRKIEETKRFLNGIGLFKFINIKFENPQVTDTAAFIDCIMQLTPFIIQSYTVETEYNNYGSTNEAALSLSYQHRNIFRGAEMFNIKLSGAAQMVVEAAGQENRYRFNSYEYGVSGNVVFPKFLIPWRKENFYKKYRPYTTLGSTYNFQTQPNYTRTIAKANLGYLWNPSQNISNILTPLEFNYVNFLKIDPVFLRNNSYRYKDFDNFFITSIWYTFVYSNNRLKSLKDYVYLRTTIELAGNLFLAGYKLTGQKKTDGSYKINNTNIAQYAMFDIDFRYNNIANSKNKLVYRITTGIGYPYGNILSMPFVKQYTAGGASEIRAWQSGRLGPGTFTDTTWYPNQTANLKIVGNFEYRFHIVWMFEGAFFIDAGNIWSTVKSEERDETKFKLNTFYKQIAVGSGLGLRVDVDFLIIRLDMALQVRDPAVRKFSGWAPFDGNLSRNDYTLHIGIGYPF